MILGSHSLYYAPEWKKRETYIDETENKLIPLVDEKFPQLAQEIGKILEYVKNHPNIKEEERQRIEDFRRVRAEKEALLGE